MHSCGLRYIDLFVFNHFQNNAKWHTLLLLLHRLHTFKSIVSESIAYYKFVWIEVRCELDNEASNGTTYSAFALYGSHLSLSFILYDMNSTSGKC
jgi:hypothetical protein